MYKNLFNEARKASTSNKEKKIEIKISLPSGTYPNYIEATFDKGKVSFLLNINNCAGDHAKLLATHKKYEDILNILSDLL